MPAWLTVDFETRGVVNLPKVGAHRYAEDPHTGIWCLAYAVDDGPVDLWTPDQPMPEIFRDLPATTFLRAWNAQFEATIWRVLLTERLGWPAIRPEQWVCAAALGARAGLPRKLEDAARVLQVLHQKDLEGHRLMLKLCQPKAWTPEGEPLWHTEPALLERMYAYCRQDVETERAVFRALPAVGHPLERRAWLLDQEINRRGLCLDRALVTGALAVARPAVAALNAAISEATEGRVTKVTQVQRLVKWCGERDFPVTTLDKAALRDHLAPDTILPPEVRTALAIRSQGAKSSIAKLETMERVVGEDGRVRDLLLYYGAGTGRWAGRLVQPQNFPRGTVKVTEEDYALLQHGDLALLEALLPSDKPVMELLASMLRGCFVAQPGHEFTTADFAAIEARVLAWLAGAKRLLALFHQGLSPYPPMGEPIFGHPTPKDGNPFEYQVSKNTVLGCGYQMGWQRFQEQAWEQTGLRLEDDLCHRAVAAYRETHWQIPDLWKELNRVCQAAVSSGSTHWLPAADGKLAFACDGAWLRMRLPSGRSLWYPFPKMSQRRAPWKDPRTGQLALVPCVTVAGVDPVTKRWTRSALYGGLLTENAVQAIARDLMVESMFRVEAAGYHVLLTVHDEIVTEAPAGHGSVDEFCHLMATPPTWAADCPIAAEGWRGRRYRKG